MATKRKSNKPSHCAIKRELRAEGVDFNKDFHTLRWAEQTAIADGAKRAGYRKPKAAAGSRGRMYFALLQKKSC